IEQAILDWRKPLEASPPGAVDQKAARLLRQKLWLPLEKALGGARTVLIAPDGLLCSLPFAALPGTRSGSYLIEEVALVQLPSVRQALTLDEGKAPQIDGLLAVGGLDYGKGAWSSLPGTALETQRLARLYRDRFPGRRAPLVLAGTRGDRPRCSRRWLH